MTHTGRCHGGRIAFEAGGKIDGALDCNGSICRGSLRWFLPEDRF